MADIGSLGVVTRPPSGGPSGMFDGYQNGLTTSMPKLLLSVQPGRSPDLPLAAVIARAEEVVIEAWIRNVLMVEHGDDGSYVNIGFETDDLPSLWQMVKRRLYEDTEFGLMLKQASMAMCEGNDGWSDYQQLHHWDPTVRLVPDQVVGRPFVKIRLRHEKYVETPWAIDLGGKYRLENSPFWAYGLSWGDIVFAEPGPDGMLEFAGVAEKSGNRTVRVIFEVGCDESDEESAILDAAVELGCSYTGANPRYICVNVPPSTDLIAVAELLTQSGVQWEHADPRYAELYPEMTNDGENSP